MNRKKIVVSLIFLSIFLFHSPLFAYRKSDMSQLVSTGNCVGCDLRGANIRGMNLSGADLSYSDLRKASFYKSNLSKANLTGANIRGTNFRGVRLSKAIWVDGLKCASNSRGRCYNKR